MKWYAVQEDQDRLVDAYIGLAEAGSTFAANLLRFTPCDLWPYLRGRTLWAGWRLHHPGIPSHPCRLPHVGMCRGSPVHVQNSLQARCAYQLPPAIGNLMQTIW